MANKIFDTTEFAKVARQAVAEGVVLLKNDAKVLPLREGTKVAIFGRSQFNYYKSGEKKFCVGALHDSSFEQI